MLRFLSFFALGGSAPLRPARICDASARLRARATRPVSHRVIRTRPSSSLRATSNARSGCAMVAIYPYSAAKADTFRSRLEGLDP